MEVKTIFEILTIVEMVFTTKTFCYDIGKLCQKGFKGTGNLFLEDKGIGFIGCGKKCVRLGGCKGFSYHRGDLTCILTDSTGYTATSDGWTFCGDLQWVKKIMGACSSETVRFGTECVELSSGQAKIVLNRIVRTQLWPQGSFCLLEPYTGCPPDFEWGYIRFPVGNGSYNSAINHVYGSVTSSYIGLYFCANAYVVGTISWPAGDYCILRSGTCPAGFLYISLHVSTTDYAVVWGKLGTYIYLSFTLLDFCCRSDGDVNIPISLPTMANFFLFRHVAFGCQKVNGMTSTSEYTHFATPTYIHGVSETGLVSNDTLNYCYYYR